MKRFFAIFLSVCIIISMLAVTASAATIEGLVAGVGMDSDRTVRVTVNYSNPEEAQESTLLVVKKGVSIVTAKSDEIRYIDQKVVEGSSVTFSFKMAQGDRVGSYDLYVGGTMIDAPDNTEISFDYNSATTIKFVNDKGVEIASSVVVNENIGGEIALGDYAPKSITHEGVIYQKSASNAESYTVAASDNVVEVLYAVDSIATIEEVSATVIEGNTPVLPMSLSAVTGEGINTTLMVESWDFSSLAAGDNVVYGTCKETTMKAEASVTVLPLSFEVADNQTVAGGNTVYFDESLANQFTIEFDMIINGTGDAWALFTTDGAAWGNSGFGITAYGGKLYVRGGNGSGTATDATLKAQVSAGESYRVLIVADASTDAFTAQATASDGTVYSADTLTFRRVQNSINSVNFIGTAGNLEFKNIKVCAADVATVTFVNENGDVVKTVKCNASDSLTYTIKASEAFAIGADSKGAFYNIPETKVNGDMTVTVYPNEEKLAVVEDAFVQGGVVYGIGTTHTDGVYTAANSDLNRGPTQDADGVLVTDGVHTPSVLGSDRVAFFNFPVVAAGDGEAVLANFYVRNWHGNTFSNANTTIRLACYAVNDSSWAQAEGGSYVSEKAPLLEGYDAAIFSPVCYNVAGYVTFDITEPMKAAAEMGLENLSIRINTAWGGANIVEREAAVEGGAYEGKAAYLEIAEGTYITVSNATKVTKNGSLMTKPADGVTVPEGSTVRMYSDSAVAFTNGERVYRVTGTATEAIRPEAGDYSAAQTGIGMVQGAQVRIGEGVDKETGKIKVSYDTDGDGVISEEEKVNGSGLRFITTVNYNDSLASVRNAQFGIELTAENAFDDEGNPIVEDVRATQWQVEGEVFTVAITNLEDTNFNRRFTATAYVDVDGQRFYGSSITRSVYEVAAGLLIEGYNGNYGESADENGNYESVPKVLIDVLNAYVNQVGVRLVLSDATSAATLTANTERTGAYTGEVFFTVSQTTYEDGRYTVTLTARGEARIDTRLFNEYVRINNNNSKVSPVTTVTDNGDGTYTIEFDYSVM